MSNDKKLVSILELSKEFDVHPRTIIRWVERGLFPAPMRFGRNRVWLRVVVDEKIHAESVRATAKNTQAAS
jgi:hypothetical protein